MADRMEPGEIPTQILRHLSEGVCLTMDALEEALGLTRRQISDGAAKLIFRGYVERVEAGCYQLTSAGIEAKGRNEIIRSGPWRPDRAKVRRAVRDTFRQRLWNAMRMSGTFTIGDLVIAASAGDRDPENNAAWYIRHLRSAGYLIELPTRQKGTRLTSNGFKRWRLLRDSGPLAPVFRPKLRGIHDYNTGEDHPCSKSI